MRLKSSVSVTAFIAVSILLFASISMAEPITWATQQYTAYAYSYADNLDSGFNLDTDTQFGPPLPIEAHSFAVAPPGG